MLVVGIATTSRRSVSLSASCARYGSPCLGYEWIISQILSNVKRYFSDFRNCFLTASRLDFLHIVSSALAVMAGKVVCGFVGASRLGRETGRGWRGCPRCPVPFSVFYHSVSRLSTLIFKKVKFVHFPECVAIFHVPPYVPFLGNETWKPVAGWVLVCRGGCRSGISACCLFSHTPNFSPKHPIFTQLFYYSSPFPYAFLENCHDFSPEMVFSQSP